MKLEGLGKLLFRAAILGLVIAGIAWAINDPDPIATAARIGELALIGILAVWEIIVTIAQGLQERAQLGAQ